MMKLLGSACVLASAWGIWTQKRREFRRQLLILRELAAALERMGDGIRLERTALPHLLERAEAGCGGAGALFRAAGASLRRGAELSEAWRAAAEALPLSEADRRTVAEAGGVLSGDAEQAWKGLEAVSAGLRRRCEALERERPERERRESALCFSAAALAIIVLL